MAPSEIVESLRHLGEDSPSHTDTRSTYASESLRDGSFDRSGSAVRVGFGARLEPQSRPPAVKRIAFALQEASLDQSLENPRDRARMETDDVCEFSSGEPRELPDHA
jgi:hypothetical protein